jgi:DtxR family manganese transport transcriptional regulator
MQSGRFGAPRDIPLVHRGKASRLVGVPSIFGDAGCGNGEPERKDRESGSDEPGKEERRKGNPGRMTGQKAALVQVSTELPDEAVQAERFEKARSAQATAVLEDYVELIDDLLASGGEARPTDIARRLGVSHATATKSIGRLKRAGLATSKAYRGVFLTPEGRALAARVRARHRLVVDLLVAVGVPRDCAERDAEGLEHHVSDVALAAFAKFLKR